MKFIALTLTSLFMITALVFGVAQVSSIINDGELDVPATNYAYLNHSYLANIKSLNALGVNYISCRDELIIDQKQLICTLFDSNVALIRRSIITVTSNGIVVPSSFEKDALSVSIEDFNRTVVIRGGRIYSKQSGIDVGIHNVSRLIKCLKFAVSYIAPLFKTDSQR